MTQNRWMWLQVLMIAGLILGCQTPQKKQPDRFEKWRDMANEAPRLTPDPGPSPAQRLSTAAPPPDVPDKKNSMDQAPPAPAKDLPDMPLTMKMHDVQVAVLLRSMARAAGINILINENVTGQAKINIVNVPWNQAFTGILDSFGLTWKWTGQILRVIAVADLNREIALMEARQKYQKSKRAHDFAMREMAKKEAAMAPLVTRVLKINFADLSELRDNLEAYLLAELKQTDKSGPSQAPVQETSQSLRGAILKDKTTNCLIIQASQADIDKILPVIRELDRPSRQVLIEAHIVEATSETAKELGIQWGGLATDGNNWIGGSREDFGTNAWDDDGNATLSGNIVDQAISSAGGGSLAMMAGQVGEYALYAQLTALQEQGKLNILSKPSITTLDHHRASIESGQDVPFQTVEDGEVNIEWRKAVISLEVTPHVVNDTIVRLEIVTHKDELDFTDTVDGNPTIITKNAATMVSLFDGQTTVIAGLNKELVEQSEAGVPWLKDVPGLGWLFKSRADGAQMQELLIFITPHILEGRTAHQPRDENG